MSVKSDAICIAALTPERAEAIRSVVTLRGMDQIHCVPLDNALISLHSDPPVLAIIDTDLAHADLVKKVVSQLPAGVAALVLSDTFDEEFFLSCHDAGVRDFLVKPLVDSYLLSRVLLALETARLNELLTKRDELLIGLGVLAPYSAVFTTSHFLRLLKEAAGQNNEPGLLVLELETGGAPMKPEVRQRLYQTVAQRIRAACRGFDVIGEYMVDKFAVLLPNTSMDGVQSLATRLQQSLDGFTMIHADGSVKLRIRIGTATYQGCRHYEDLINRALSDLQADPAPVG